MAKLSEQEVENIKAFVDKMVTTLKQDISASFTPDRLEAKINAVTESDKNKNNKIDPVEATGLIHSFISTSPSGQAMLSSLCEHAAIDDQKGKNAKQFLAANAEKSVSGINFIKAIAEATQKGVKTPESAIESYRFMELSVPSQEVRSYVDKANKEVALAISEQIGGILKKNKVLTDKAVNFPDTSELGTLDANQFCIGINNIGIGKTI